MEALSRTGQAAGTTPTVQHARASHCTTVTVRYTYSADMLGVCCTHTHTHTQAQTSTDTRAHLSSRQFLLHPAGQASRECQQLDVKGRAAGHAATSLQRCPGQALQLGLQPAVTAAAAAANMAGGLRQRVENSAVNKQRVATLQVCVSWRLIAPTAPLAVAPPKDR